MSPRAKRGFFRVADDLTDHFAWIFGARLAVFLVVAKHTNFARVWSGWTIAELADEAALARSSAIRALHELARLSPEPVNRSKGIGRRQYIRLELGRGRSPNVVEILHHLDDRDRDGQTDLPLGPKKRPKRRPR